MDGCCRFTAFHTVAFVVVASSLLHRCFVVASSLLHRCFVVASLLPRRGVVVASSYTRRRGVVVASLQSLFASPLLCFDMCGVALLGASLRCGRCECCGRCSLSYFVLLSRQQLHCVACSAFLCLALPCSAPLRPSLVSLAMLGCVVLFSALLCYSLLCSALLCYSLLCSAAPVSLSTPETRWCGSFVLLSICSILIPVLDS